MSKERPILFSGPMVRAILEGRKTQTRRVVKLQPGPDAYITPFEDRFVYGGLIEDIPSQVRHGLIDCPHGRRQDRLWVRETWLPLQESHFCVRQLPKEAIVEGRVNGAAYRADFDADAERCRVELGYSKWRPSIHMPRWASRITLEVKAVRVERLQQISIADAVAEGVDRSGEFFWKNYTGDGHCLLPTTSYGTLWNSINGPKSWDANPWVWVVEFERVPSATNPA